MSNHPIISAIHQRYSSRTDLIESVLTHMGSERIKRSGKEFRSTCPLHRGDGPNFTVWFHNGVVTWKCFSRACGRGPLHTLPMHRYGFTEQQAVAWLAQMSGLQVDGSIVCIPERILDEAETRAFERRYAIEQPPEYEVMPEDMVSYSMGNHSDYWIKRGFNHEVLQRFQVGFVPGGTWVRPNPSGEVDAHGRPKLSGWFEDRTSVPIRLKDGTLIGFSGRRLDGLDFQKYKVLPGTMKGFSLYGLHLPEVQRAIQKTRKLVVVEGFPDVWRAWMHRIYNVTSFMGTDATTFQIDLIGSIPLKEILFYFDGDAAGQIAAKKYAASVNHLATLKNAVPPKNAKGKDQDPGDLIDREAFLTPLVEAKVFQV